MARSGLPSKLDRLAGLLDRALDALVLVCAVSCVSGAVHILRLGGPKWWALAVGVFGAVLIGLLRIHAAKRV